MKHLCSIAAFFLLFTTAHAENFSFVGTGTDGNACELHIVTNANQKITLLSITGHMTQKYMQQVQHPSQTVMYQYDPNTGFSENESISNEKTHLKWSVNAIEERAYSEFTIQGDIHSAALASAAVEEEIFAFLVIPFHEDAIQCVNLVRE